MELNALIESFAFLTGRSHKPLKETVITAAA
jgi:hypothetical protein